MNERERLIELIENGFNEALRKFKGEDKDEKACEYLADYLIENGVIAPPVKVGDTVYVNIAWTCGYLRKNLRPYKSKVVFIGIDINGKRNFMNAVYEKKHFTFGLSFDEIGNRVFLTREEAEKDLANHYRQEEQKGIDENE